MEFTVTVKVGPPAGLEMDPLRREGAQSALGGAIAAIVESIEPENWWPGTWWTTDYEDGVPAVMAIEADSAEEAADRGRGVVRSALAHEPLLVGWRIVGCDAAESEGA